jgi:CMP-N,N'-diacetyllegionaminic acid synthase
MIEGKSVIAVIPARGGSKGLPRKNVKPLLGKPLLAWSIEAAQKSRHVDAVVVSTDDEEIATAARQCSVAVPYLRPSSLATDTATTHDVLMHVLEEEEYRGRRFDYLALLEPTSPLREAQDVDAAIERLVRHPSAKSIVGLAKSECGHPEFTVVLNEDRLIRSYTTSSGEFRELRRQELREAFFFEGTIYVSEVDHLKRAGTFYHASTLGYVVPKWKSYEVDDIFDFFVVEAMLKARQNHPEAFKV